MTHTIGIVPMNPPLSRERQRNSMECLHDADSFSDVDMSEFELADDNSSFSQSPPSMTSFVAKNGGVPGYKSSIAFPRTMEPLLPPVLLPTDLVALADLGFSPPADCKIEPIMQQADWDMDWKPAVDTSCTAEPEETNRLMLEDLADDLHLHILSFLELSDCRALMATTRRFRSLFLSDAARGLWLNWCSKHWPMFMDQLKKGYVVDDLHLPKAAQPPLAHLDKIHEHANMALLLSLAERQPTDIDKERLNSSVDLRRYRRRDRHHRASNNLMLRHWFDPSLDLWVVKFDGRVGQGDRCVRADLPLPRPKPNQTRFSSLIPVRERRKGSRNGDLSQVVDIFCRSAKAVVVRSQMPTWRPFVAPFMTMSALNSGPSVHLTPRFVSYFEVSILEDKSSTASPEMTMPSRIDDNVRQHADCVAVGVATESFDWHSRMPGWDSSSFGYHGDDGGIFHELGVMVRQYGPRFGRGDTVGCGVDYAMQGIFFTLNGKFLGYAWTKLSLHLFKKDLYPVVGIDTNDLIHCNYGAEPFVFDLTKSLLRHEELVRQSLGS